MIRWRPFHFDEFFSSNEIGFAVIRCRPFQFDEFFLSNEIGFAVSRWRPFQFDEFFLPMSKHVIEIMTAAIKADE